MRAKGLIYFVQRKSGGPIKIGTSVILSKRLKKLSETVGEELVVLAVMDGSFPVERKLHQKFAAIRVEGEWFECHDSLLEFIQEAGIPWDGVDERAETIPVRIPSELFHRANQVAAFQNRTPSEVVADLLKDPLKETWDFELAEAKKRFDLRYPPGTYED